ncbi:MAG: radical SAM protein, partial [Candidatus Njordarchaeota archaeon]
MSNIVVREIKAKTILSKSRIYGVQYSINPYIGCTHGCVYCYARFTFIARNIRSDLWGKIIFPKINAPKLLLEEIKHRRKGTVLLSSVTDAYNNLEKKYNLTKRIIEILKKRHWPIVILTKSDL